MYNDSNSYSTNTEEMNVYKPVFQGQSLKIY